MQIGPFEIPFGERSHKTNDEMNQKHNIDGSGVAVVYDETHVARTWEVTFRCSEDLSWDIRDFIVNGMRMRMNTFTYVDDFGISHNVRYWNNSLSRTFIAPDLWEIKMIFREVV